MQGKLNVVYTKGNVDVLVSGVVGGLDCGDILKNSLQHIVNHLIAEILPNQHNVVNEDAFDVLCIIIGIGGNHRLGVIAPSALSAHLHNLS